MTPSANPVFYKVRRPDTGQIGEVAEHNLDQAILLGGEVVDELLQNEPTQPKLNDNVQSSPNIPSEEPIPQQVPQTPSNIPQQSEKMYKVKRPDTGEIGEVSESNLAQAKKMGGEVVDQGGQELSYTDRLLQFGRGVSEVPAVLGDLGNKYIAAPVQDAKGKVVETAGKIAGVASEALGNRLKESAEDDYRIADEMRNTTYTQDTHNKFNELAGKDITPKDKTGDFLNSAGNFATPIPGAGVLGGLTTKALVSQGVKQSAKQAAGGLGRHSAIAAGGAAALEGTKDYRVFEEGSMGRHVEDFLQSVVGMSLADKGLSSAKKAILAKTSKNLEGIIDHSNKLVKDEAIEALEKPSLGGKILSLGAKPNHEINALAKKYDIELPFEIALGGKPHKFVSNTFLKSLFTARAYEDIIMNADKDMINAVKDKISKVSPEQVSGQTSSLRTSEFLKGEKSAIKDESKQLYDEAYSLLKPTDGVVPVDTIKSIKSMLNIPSLKAAVPGPEAKPIAKYLLDIGEQWGIIPSKNTLRELENSPGFLKKVIESFEKNPQEISMEKLIGQLQSTYQHTKYQSDIPGLKNLYNGLVSSMNNDIRRSTNKEFISKWENANQYFKQNQVDRIRSSLAKSIMDGEIPKEAFDYMGGVPEIRKLQKIIGDSPNGKVIFNELKRAKLDQVVSDKIIDASGSILYGQLSNMFLRNPEKQALLKELLGESYDGMKELAKISQEFVKSGKDFGNPSKTTLSARDVQGLTDVFKFGLNNFGVGAATLASKSVGFTGLEAPAATYALSLIVSNRNYINTAVKYAKSSNQKEKTTLANRLSKIAKHILIDEPSKYPQSVIPLYKDNAMKAVENDKKNNN